MSTIGLVVRRDHEEAARLGRELVSWVKSAGHRLACEEGTAQEVGFEGAKHSREELVELCDPIVTLGGDGTLIGVARHIGAKSPVMIGVNFGQLGFLTELAPDQLFETIEAVFAGQAKYGERAILMARVERSGKRVFESQAVNDAVVQKGARDKLLDLDFSVNGEGVARVRGDGIIVATPTGSTAYSLAAGGSIVYPQLSVMLVTPICAHSLTSRPLILPLDSQFEMVLPEYGGSVFLSIDGQDSVSLEVGDRVVVTCSPHSVKFVRSADHSYFEILRTKLHWGMANRGSLEC